MRAAFAHDAVVALDAGADEAAPGGAITAALCGHAEHEPPCPLAPHHTAAQRQGPDLHLRILFATAPEQAPGIRALITAALAARWPLRSSTAGTVRSDEADHAGRLVRS